MSVFWGHTTVIKYARTLQALSSALVKLVTLLKIMVERVKL